MTRIVASSLAFLALTLSAEAPAEELRVCRDLADDQARLACYDAIVDRNMKGEDTRPDTIAGKGTAAAPTGPGVTEMNLSQEDLFGKSSKEVGRAVAEATDTERIDSLSATVTRLQKYGYEKVLITLDNGQVWRQVDVSSLRLRVGDSVDIERAALGSFMLRKQGNNRRMRVSRKD